MPAPGSTPILIYNSATASQVPSAANLSQGELAINVTDKKLYTKDSGGNVILIASNGGDVTGPATATDNAIARFDATTGRLIQNSVVTIADTTGNMAGVGTLTATTVNAALNGSLGATTPSTAVVTSLTDSGLTSGRVTYASTGGLLADSANLTFSGTTLSLNGLIRIDNGGNILGKSDNTGFPSIYGGGAYNSGAGIGLGGSSNSTLPNTIIFTRGAYVESARIDSSGNLGLGVTPSAWGSGSTVVQMGSGYSVSKFGYLQNAYYDGSNYKAIVTGLSTLYQPSSGQHVWYTAASAVAGATATFTQAMTLDASGRLGLGTTDPNTKLELRADTTTAGNESNILMFNYTSGTTPYYIGGIFGAGYRDVRFPAYCAGIDFYRSSSAGGLASAGEIRFYTDGSGGTQAELRTAEKMRLTATGDLLVGKTNTSDSTGVGLIFRGSVGNMTCTADSATTAVNTYHLYNLNATNNGYRFYVNVNGGVSNYSANNINLSDERVKKDIVNAGNYLDKICAIPVRTFLYKDQSDDDLNLGVIAQEVEAVAPELVDLSGFGETPEDGVPLKAIYQTDLQYALMKSIQELKAMIDELKAKVAALEAA